MEASRPPTLILTHEKEKRKGGERRGESGARPSQIFMLKVIGGPRRNVDLAANTLLSKESTKMS